MAKVIEFYVRDLILKKVTSVPCDRRGEVIEFPKDLLQDSFDDLLICCHDRPPE